MFAFDMKYSFSNVNLCCEFAINVILHHVKELVRGFSLFNSITEMCTVQP
jgi:hypothetical protein